MELTWDYGYSPGGIEWRKRRQVKTDGDAYVHVHVFNVETYSYSVSQPSLHNGVGLEVLCKGHYWQGQFYLAMQIIQGQSHPH